MLLRTKNKPEYTIIKDYRKALLFKKKIHGNTEYYQILRILESPEDPIIKNNKWKKALWDVNEMLRPIENALSPRPKLSDTDATAQL